MARISPVSEENAGEKVVQTYERLREMFDGQPIPPCFGVYARVPSFLHDFYMNFKKFIWTEGHLDLKTKSTIGLAVALVYKNGEWIDFFAARCTALGWPEQHFADVTGVVAACQMYNVFFKFRDLAGSDRFSNMGGGLRAHTFAGTSLDAKLVELINVVISDMNGCKPCTSGHVQKAIDLGLSDDEILESIQCAATIVAGCSFLNSAGF